MCARYSLGRLMRVFEYLFEIKPDGRGWRLASPSQDQALYFDTYSQAEHRARWLAVRQEVRGFLTEIRILDASGDVIGAWRGERYQAVRPSQLDQAA